MSAPPAGQAGDRELARAVESLGKAVGRLVGLLDDRDEGVVAAAASALVKVGPAVVARLGAALRTAPGPRHRGRMVVVLEQIAGRDPIAVSEAPEAACEGMSNPSAEIAPASRTETVNVLPTGYPKGPVAVGRRDRGGR
jgi:hypothetical protein